MLAKSKLKRWGNSYGVLVPKEIVEKEGLKEGEMVEITVRKAVDIKATLWEDTRSRTCNRRKNR